MIIKYDPAEEFLSAPVEVRFEITWACDHKCIHCYNDSGIRRQDELSTAEAKDVLDQLAEMKVCEVLFEGGEPFLREDFLDLLRHSRNKFRTSLSTNGSFITPEIASQLVKAGVSFVQISVDGARAETHDYIRGKKGSFKRAMETVENLKKNGVTVGMAMVLIKPNVHEALDFIKLAQSLKVHCALMRLQPIGRAFTNRSQLELTGSEFKEIYPEILKYRSTVTDIPVYIDFNLFPFLFTKSDKPRSPNRLTECVECAEHISILPNGDVVPCPCLRSFAVGNVRKTSLKSLWSSSPILKRIREISINDSCRACQHYPYCRGGCRLFPWVEKGDLTAKDSFCWLGNSRSGGDDEH